MSAKNNAVDKTVSRFVDEAIKSKKVVVFLKSMCPHCISTQKCLGTYIPHTLKAEDYSEIPLGECHKCRHVLEYLKVLTGKHTVTDTYCFYLMLIIETAILSLVVVL